MAHTLLTDTEGTRKEGSEGRAGNPGGLPGGEYVHALSILMWPAAACAALATLKCWHAWPFAPRLYIHRIPAGRDRLKEAFGLSASQKAGKASIPLLNSLCFLVPGEMYHLPQSHIHSTVQD